MVRAPFVAFFRVVPDRANGHRFEYIRSLQRLGAELYEELLNISEINIAQPGGGQVSHIINNSYLSQTAYGMQVVPQFGNFPAQLRIAGFFNYDGIPAQTTADKMVFNTGSVVSGPSGQYPWLPSGLPTTAIEDEVVTLKALLDTAASGVDTVTLFKLDYKGIIWGDRGHHFPK